MAVLRMTILGLGALAVAGTALGAIDENAAVPVDVSIISQGTGKGFIFQNVYAQPFYIYDKDQPGKSACVDKCAEVWIPLYPSDRNATDLGDAWKLIVRTDGYKQWAYKGKPLYTFGYGELPPPTAKDTAGVWHKLEP